VLTRYLDAVMLICTKDSRQRITGFAGVAAGKIEMLFIDPQHAARAWQATAALRHRTPECR
jgi:hypothetical protein